MHKVTHQHSLQRTKIVPISLPIYCFLEVNCVSQPYEFLTDIHSLCKTSAMRNSSTESRRQSAYAHLALNGVVELDTRPRRVVGVRVAAQFGLKRFPAGRVRQPIKVIQGHLAPLIACRRKGTAENALGTFEGWQKYYKNNYSSKIHLQNLQVFFSRLPVLPLGLTPAKLHSIAWNGKLRKSLLKC